jgi:hypothetical protein
VTGMWVSGIMQQTMGRSAFWGTSGHSMSIMMTRCAGLFWPRSPREHVLRHRIASVAFLSYPFRNMPRPPQWFTAAGKSSGCLEMWLPSYTVCVLAYTRRV